MRGAKPEMAEVFERFFPAYQRRYGVAPHQQRAVWAIRHCRTALLGGHVDVCTACGALRISYNSCGNRHCPKCQWGRQRQWLERRLAEVLPVAYYHVIFTLPDKLNPVVRYNEGLMYNLLLRSAWASLQELCRDKKQLGAEVGMLAVLHTWGQNLSLHPHVHAIVPAGGLSADKRRWVSPKRGSFFVSFRALSALFRAKFLAGLKNAFHRGQLRFDEHSTQLADSRVFNGLCRLLYDIDWVVYGKRPFGGPAQVLRYLGRYPHRVAISSSRLEAMSDQQVTFWYKDYRQQGQRKLLTLEGVEFVRRFLQHILPAGFSKIRYYGILSNRGRQERLALCRTLILAAGAQQHDLRPVELPPLPDEHVCPICGRPAMIRWSDLPGVPARAPPLPLAIRVHNEHE